MLKMGFTHWRNLYNEQRRLQPIETMIKNDVRAKWMLRVSFDALSRYRQIRDNKKRMYASIRNYRTKVILENSFKKFVANLG